MKTFKEFLLEQPSYSRDSIEMMFRCAIPLTAKITKEIDKISPKMKVYHATTLEHLKGLKDLGKTSKQISTFSKGLGSVINTISIKPDIMAVLEGQGDLISDTDIYSHPDENGIRWINTRGDFLQEAMIKPTIKKMYQLADKPLDNDHLYDIMFDDTTLLEEYKEFEFNSKQRKELVKFYEDNLVRLMKKKIYKDFIITQIEKIKNPALTHNEIIMSKFKVIGVYAIEAGKFQFDHSMAEFQITNLGYKYLGFIPKEDFKKF